MLPTGSAQTRSCLLSRLRPFRGERGQILAWALIFLALGALVVTPMLGYASTVFRGQAYTFDRTQQQYAAEAAIRCVMADLAMGADAIPTTYNTYSPHKPGQPYTAYQITTSYAASSVIVNGYTAAASIAAPQVGAVPAGSQQYIDPGASAPQLSSVSTGTGYLMRLFNVRAGTLIVNWAYSPAGRARVAVWDGLPVNPSTGVPYPPGQIASFPVETPVADSHWSNTTANSVRTPALATQEGKVYSIVFFIYAGQAGSRTTQPFAGGGGADETWMYLAAYRDYLITATAGDVAIRGYIRQVPGYSQPPTTWSASSVTWVPNRTFIRSWTLP
jgi:Tfp pilus assembly protein PilX